MPQACARGRGQEYREDGLMNASIADFANPIAPARAYRLSRVCRLPFGKMPFHTRLGPVAAGLFLLATIALPHVRAGEEGAKPDSKTSEKVALARDTGEFELLVVGPDGKPVPGARIELRGDQLPAAEQIRRGTF